jgi:hypothetical protein
MPTAPPEQRSTAAPALNPLIRLQIEYDEHLLEQHGSGVEDFIREAVAIYSVEWQRYRREWFEIESIRLRPSGDERDGAYILASFLQRTASAPRRLHISLVGRPIEVYTNGGAATPVGGLAYRGTDAVLVSALPGAGADLVAYYLFHEIGHCYDAFDLPFRGGESTFGNKSRITFEVDAGNAVIIDESPGPRARRTPGRAPAIMRKKFARARTLGLDARQYARIHDLLLHEPSPSNPSYMRKKEELLAAAGDRREVVTEFLARYELTPTHIKRDDEIRARVAEHYWRANEALEKNDYATAEAELAEITAVDPTSRDVHLLVGAVERKIRRRR